MNRIVPLFILLIYSTVVFAVEKDTLVKKQRVIYFIGLGVNTNQFKNDNFHYYNNPNGRDAVIQDYDISVSKVYYPLLQLGGYKTILNRRKFSIDFAINNMVWLTEEKYKIKGTNTLVNSGFVESLEINCSTRFISNSFNTNFSFLYNSGQSRIGVFLGTGLNYLIFYKSRNEGTSLTFNTKWVDKSEGYEDNFKFNFELTPGVEFHYKIGKLNLKSQLFVLKQISRYGSYSFHYFRFNERNYLLFFSTAIKI